MSRGLQALDGVTTALEMEIGVYPVGEWLASWEGRAVINYGATVSHPGARTKLLTGIDVGHSLTLPPGSDIAEIWSGDHMYEPIADEQIAGIGALISACPK